ncbi:zf-HC2 domain-containing protein [Streptomyces sp. B6B3]|uniref:anti-sigma factor family protein n=1 Tax=Streptomyces sp. B6B3 TaxID=3153570 RepID=UPI00325E9772
MTSAPETGPADQHLGESLAALIDGELSHDRRDRVLAHLATCPSCKAEADAQRRLKSVFAQSPLPALSAGLLARLQGLPATDGAGPALDDGPDEEPPGPDFGPLPGGRGRESLLGPPVIGGERGFRIHEPGAAVRLHRGHRLAFAAAGAVSLAAFAIGGAMSSAGTVGAGTGSNGSTLSTVAAGGGAPVSTARPTSARGSETEESTDRGVSLPITLVSYTGDYPEGLNPSGTSGSTGLAEGLFPALGPILAPGPVSESSTSASTPMLTGLAPAGGSGGIGTMNAR